MYFSDQLTIGDLFDQGFGVGFEPVSGKYPLIPPTAKFKIK